MTIQTKQACKAIWTPWATLWCGPCHGRKDRFGDVIDTTDRKPEPVVPVKPYPDCAAIMPAVTTCDQCGCAVQTIEDAGYLKALGFEGAKLWQTGGMCAGLAITLPDQRLIFISMLDGPYCATLNENAEAFAEGEDPLDSFEGDCDDDDNGCGEATADALRVVVAKWRASK